MVFCPFIGVVACVSKSDSCRTGAMTFDPNHEEPLRELQQELHRAHTITPGLMADVIAGVCQRLPTLARTEQARVVRLVASGALVDAALVLLAVDLPQWKLRRLIYDDGQWHCSLTKHIGLPAELDDMAEADHESLPLAILSAFVEARRHSLTADEVRPKSVPQVRPTREYAICCDNFA